LLACGELRRTPYLGSSRRTPLRLGGCFAKPANGHTTGQVDAHDRNTDIDLQILDLLREQSPKSAYRLASELPRRPGEQALGTHAVRKRLEALAFRGLVAGSASAQAAAAGKAEAPALADPWRITEEGLAVVEPEAGVASAPYDREVVGGEEGGGRDAGFWVLIAIAVVTAVCAAYSLLVASGVLGGA
jgi:hypothetical protein